MPKVVFNFDTDELKEKFLEILLEVSDQMISSGDDEVVTNGLIINKALQVNSPEIIKVDTLGLELLVMKNIKE